MLHGDEHQNVDTNPYRNYPQSHVCILQTTLDLLHLGLEVFVLADGVSSSNKPEVAVALEVSPCLRRPTTCCAFGTGPSPATKPADPSSFVIC